MESLLSGFLLSLSLIVAIGTQNAFVLKQGLKKHHVFWVCLVKEHTCPARPLLTPPSRAPPETLPLFAGKESPLSQFNQQGRRRKPLGLDRCVLQFKNERI